jgi:hypothetical protein
MSFVVNSSTSYLQRNRDWFEQQAKKNLREKRNLKFMTKIDCMKQHGMEKKVMMADYDYTIDWFWEKVRALDHEIENVAQHLDLGRKRKPVIEKSVSFVDQNEGPRKMIRKNAQNQFEEVDFPPTQPNSPELPNLSPEDWKELDKPIQVPPTPPIRAPPTPQVLRTPRNTPPPPTPPVNLEN